MQATAKNNLKENISLAIEKINSLEKHLRSQSGVPYTLSRGNLVTLKQLKEIKHNLSEYLLFKQIFIAIQHEEVLAQMKVLKLFSNDAYYEVLPYIATIESSLPNNYADKVMRIGASVGGLIGVGSMVAIGVLLPQLALPCLLYTFVTILPALDLNQLFVPSIPYLLILAAGCTIGGTLGYLAGTVIDGHQNKHCLKNDNQSWQSSAKQLGKIGVFAPNPCVVNNPAIGHAAGVSIKP